jgi:hypothetical protein
MFELYAHNIDPYNTEFQAFIKRYVSLKEKRNPESIPYPELYKTIRDGIREYLKKTEEVKGRAKR